MKVKGCENCSNTGYWGRAGIFEFLKITDDIQRLILEKKRFQRHQGSCPKEWYEDPERGWLVEGQTGNDHHLRSLKGDPGGGDPLGGCYKNTPAYRQAGICGFVLILALLDEEG